MINENEIDRKELSLLKQYINQALLNLNKKGATICQEYEYEAIVAETLSVKIRGFRTSTKEVQQALINSYSHAIIKLLPSTRRWFEAQVGVVTISINEAYFAYAEKKVGDMATLSVKQAGSCLAGNGRVVIDKCPYSKKAVGILITPDPKAASKHNMVVAVHLENNAASGKGKLRQVAVDAKAAWNTIPLLRRERLNLENITSGILITDNKEKLLMLPNKVLPVEEKKKKKKMGV